MRVPGFTPESLDLANQLLFAEGQENPLEGQCNQKQKRKASRQQRTPAQQQADQDRATARRGQDEMSSSVRSEAAKKGAATRAKCGKSSPSLQQGT